MVFVIIPAYNEGRNIKPVVESVYKYVKNIVVVDDASGDDTYRQAKRTQARVLRHIINRGQGAALQTGTDYALKKGARIIIHFDADGQFKSEEIGDFVSALQTGDCDVCLGSRFLGRKSNLPWFKKNLIFPLARIINRYFFKIKLTDPQSGFRGFGRKAASKIWMQQDGSAHCSEFMYKALRQGLKVKEIPITVVYHDYGQGFFSGKGRGMGGVAIIKDLLLAKFL